MIVQIAQKEVLTKPTRTLLTEKYASIYLQIKGGNTGKITKWEETHT